MDRRCNAGFDRELKYLLVILQRIGGDGYTTVARESLRRIVAHDFVDALDVAEPCVAYFVEELQGISDRFINTDPSSAAHHLAFFSLRLLAAAGDRDRLIAAAVKRTGNIEIRVPALLAEHPPSNDEKFEMLLRQIEESTGQDRVAAVYALGLTGRAEAVSHLETIGSLSDDAEVRSAAYYALEALIDSGVAVSPDSFDFEEDLLARLRAFLRIGTPEALDRAARELIQLDSPTTDLLDIGAALIDPARGPRVATWAWPHIQKHPVQMWNDAWWHVPRYVPEAREFLIEHATGSYADACVSAATVLAETDPVFAKQVVERAILDHVPGHPGLSATLLRIAPVHGAVFLRNHLLEEQDEDCRMAMGRSARRYPDGFLALLPEMFASSDPTERRCACEIAGWLRENPHKEDLKTLAVNDASTTVQQAAINALRRQAEFAAARELRDELVNATGMRAFTYADALAETADPIVLWTSDDPLCIWPVVQQQPMLLRRHLSEKLEECLKAVQERAKRKTSDRRDERD